MTPRRRPSVRGAGASSGAARAPRPRRRAEAAAAPRAKAAVARPLEELGISEAEERLYRHLLAHPGTTAQKIASALSLPPRKAQWLLEAIEAKGLVTHSPERPRRYIPASPNIAIETLVLERQDRLQRARDVAQELEEQARSGRAEGAEPVVELVSSREAGRQIMAQIDRLAKQEVSVLIRLPILVSNVGGAGAPSQREALARGVRFRSIVDADYLATPGAPQQTMMDLEAGEEIRVCTRLPFKMLMADRRIAFIPLHPDKADTPMLLLRSSALLDALHALFEILWERAAPISVTRGGELRSAAAPDAGIEGARDLLPLLAAGLNDKSIAHELGISERTLGRRVVELMKVLDARTRFQAGWLSATRRASAAARERGRRG